MKGKLWNSKMLAVYCGMALIVGMGVTLSAKDDDDDQYKKKQQRQVQKQQKVQNKQLARMLQKPERVQHERRLTDYRQYLGQRQQLHQQSLTQLQREKRTAQYRYQRQYAAQMLQQQRRYGTRNFNYNSSYFNTPYDRRYNRGGTYYETNRYGESQLQQAVRYGYAEGFRAGMADRQDRWRSDYERSIAYQDANYGYNGYYVGLNDYNYYFREGFRRGYEDGFNRRYQYGRRISGNYSILGSVLAGILSFELLR